MGLSTYLRTGEWAKMGSNFTTDINISLLSVGAAWCMKFDEY
jgi:hypothetical protein